MASIALAVDIFMPNLQVCQQRADIGHANYLKTCGQKTLNSMEGQGEASHSYFGSLESL